jgi:uncharacterized repeat protein (TIGR01451 family)
VTYTLTITNRGPNAAENVSALNEGPAGALFVSVEASQGICTGGSEAVCSLGTLAAGGVATMRHSVRLGAEGPSVASVQSSATDPNPLNNREVTIASAGGGPPPPPSPSPPPTPPPPPATTRPEFNETVNVREVQGRVLVKLPGTDDFVDIRGLRQIPVGSQIDTRQGHVLLTVETPGGGLESSVFYDGIFTVLQNLGSAAGRALADHSKSIAYTELRLVGGNFAQCRGGRILNRAGQRPAKPVRRLWGNGKGHFRTRGRFASATVRGTLWVTTDRCDGTLIAVRRGSVEARDLVRGRVVVVPAGKSYLARARR